MLDLQVIGVRQVVDPEKLLDFSDAFLRQIYDFILFIDNKISAFFYFNPHNGVHFGKLMVFFSARHLLGKNITGFI